MSEMITVGISDMNIAKGEQSLVTYALGSCVGICMYEPVLKIGAMGHIMLPFSSNPETEVSVNKYADTCIKHMLAQMQALHCPKNRLTVKIAGGAKMFAVSGDSSFGNIGARNVEAVKQILQESGLILRAEDTGLNFGRTLFLHAATGKVEVKSFNRGVKEL